MTDLLRDLLFDYTLRTVALGVFTGIVFFMFLVSVAAVSAA